MRQRIIFSLLLFCFMNSILHTEEMIIRTLETDVAESTLETETVKIGDVDVCEWIGVSSEALAEQFPYDPEKTLVLLTHGTMASTNEWYQAVGTTHQLIAEQAEHLHIKEFDSFKWEQPFFGILRLEQVAGGKKLKDRIEDASNNGIEHVVIIAHSNGGAVSKNMSRWANPNKLMKLFGIKPINNIKSIQIITLGTPNVDNSFFVPKKVEPILNCFSISDDIQDGAADITINPDYGINVQFQIQEPDGSITHPEHTDMYSDCMVPWLLYLHIKFGEQFVQLKENNQCGIITFYRDMSQPPEFAVRSEWPEERIARPFNTSYSILFPLVMLKQGLQQGMYWIKNTAVDKIL